MKDVAWKRMLDSRAQLQRWVDTNVENGNLFKRGTSKEADSMADFEIQALFEVHDRGDIDPDPSCASLPIDTMSSIQVPMWEKPSPMLKLKPLLPPLLPQLELQMKTMIPTPTTTFL
jgi:hypothetical protein